MAAIFWESPSDCFWLRGARMADFLLQKKAGRDYLKLSIFDPPVILAETDIDALARFLNPKGIFHRQTEERALREFIGFKAWGGQRNELEALPKAKLHRLEVEYLNDLHL